MLLQRRARRRLVGAIALVVLAVIVLPIVFDKEPRPISQDIVIQIPSQNSGKFNTKVVPPPAPPLEKSGMLNPDTVPAAPAPMSGAAQAPSEADMPQDKGASKAEAAAKAQEAKVAQAKAQAQKAPEAKAAENKLVVTKGAEANAASKAPAPQSPDAEAVRAQAALQSDSYIIPLGAFLNQANVKTLQAKVTVAGYKSYSEIQKVAKGEQIRVRAGPFPSREAAERARVQLEAAGLTVGPVSKL